MADALLHHDPDAGVTFPIPFPDAMVKTSAQVTGLVLEDVKTKIPDDAAFSSGVYAKEGIPFILVWTRADKAPPSQGDVESLAKMMVFDKGELRGYLKEPIPVSGGLKTLILTQIAKGETIQVGYYYKSPPDAALFEKIVEGFSLDAGKKLSPEALPSGPSGIVMFGIGLLAFTVGFAAVMLTRRASLKKSARPSPARGTA